MSIKDLANELAARGRYGDTELVHMSKGEVAGLQQLAEAAGGSLTINPDTGKPEAFFVAALLPMLAGSVGASLGLGALGTAALGAGAGALLNPEDRLGGAFMGGLGGLGGGQFANALGAAGTAGTAMGSAIPGQAAAELATTEAAKRAVAAGATGQGSQAAMLAAQNIGAPTAQLATTTLAPSSFAAAGQGISGLGTNMGRDAAMQSLGGIGGLARAGAMAGAPMIAGAMTPRGGPSGMPEEEDTEDLMGRYTFDPGATGGTRAPGTAFTGQRRFFDPRFIRNAQGGEVKKFADGGEASASSSDFDPARGMTGASADAMNYLNQMNPSQQDGGASAEAMQYLMGQQPTTRRVQAAPVQATPFVAPTRMQSTISDTKGFNLIGDGEFSGMYQGATPKFVFDPGSQQFFRTDPVFRFAPPPPPRQQNSFSDGFAEGGLAALAQGGMEEGGFVVPADVVSMAGEGNTDAGYARIKRMIPGATPIKGKDGGQADTVRTSIEGKQPAAVAHGEMYLPPAAVKKAGGAKKLYAMMDSVREQAKGSKKQIKPVNMRKALA